MPEDRGWPVTEGPGEEPICPADADTVAQAQFIEEWMRWAKAKMDQLRNVSNTRLLECMELKERLAQKDEAIKGLEAYLKTRTDPLKIVKPGGSVRFRDSDPVRGSVRATVNRVQILSGDEVWYTVCWFDGFNYHKHTVPASLVLTEDQADVLPFRAEG